MMTSKQIAQYIEGVTLETIVTLLVERHGWEELGRLITIRCFTDNPSIKSSLKFLRQTPWARTEVEMLYCLKKDDYLTYLRQKPPANNKNEY